ncbi:MAG TPA: TetR/AcrR family transcriptional regulator [Devosia sp.]|jgi:AcrR family transcriptional regulator|uniref:TetR/AcrR family transcriptional regulator n=1 Tax=Devosia sp. TaxID=1871048 RepID=UPI002DDD220E|nr:TetR/AcrR family transcriptional regulator [Devosia sp.]HEV2515319.1 TetR/AcrR family transcriptional regulator [Devosia sp.]
MRKGNETRERILDIAEAGVLAKGFGATSIDEIIAEAGITKSGFFYHFRDKNELARGLLSRYRGRLEQLVDEVFGRAAQLSDDPLQKLLIGLTLFAEHMAGLPGGHPGCLVATMSYQDQLFNREIRGLVNAIVEEWNAFFRRMVEAIVAAYPLRDPIDPGRIARNITCAIDGGIIMSKSLGDPSVLPEQMLMARNYVKMLFQPAAVHAMPREALAA